MSYETAAFQYGDGQPWPEHAPKRRPGDMLVRQSDDPREGMRTRGPDDSRLVGPLRRVRGDPVQEYIIPLHGPNHYVPPEPVVDRHAAGELAPAEFVAIRALEGQPVWYRAGGLLDSGQGEVGCLLGVTGEDSTSGAVVYSESAGGLGHGTSFVALANILKLGRAFYLRRELRDGAAPASATGATLPVEES